MVVEEKVMRAKSLISLLSGIVDYAGLFPPATLSMRDAVRNYSEYKRSSDVWMLGRFVVPLTRLTEFEESAEPFLPKDSSPWRLSVLGGTNYQNDVAIISDFNARCIGAIIDSVELKATRVEEILAAASVLPKSLLVFVEIPIHEEPSTLLHTIGNTGLKAKVRTGGVTADAFPSSENLVQFIHTCISFNVQFKATAGLHHPIRSIYNLTYKPDSERGMMYGYLNVFLAAAFLKNGMSREEAKLLLEEREMSAFKFSHEGVRWNSFSLTSEQLHDARKSSALAFGSCSFREPIEDLRSSNLL